MFSNKMRFSIQEEGKEKQYFHTIFDAPKVTGLDSRTIYAALKREDSRYRRRSDKKVFYIQRELEDEKIFIIVGEEIKSINEFKEKFGLSSTKFFQSTHKKKQRIF